MLALMEELFPICRSITGDGLRETLRIIGSRIPLEVHEVPSGTSVLDWTIPDEWNIRAAYVTAPDGRKIVDFVDSNLHVVSYSEPVRATLPLAELLPHLHTLPARPDRIPYRTSYYERNWGFCLAHRQLEGLPDGDYEVVLESRLEPGSLSYGECLVEGETDDEILLTAHVCHPSLANDNLSGISVLTEVGSRLREARRRFSYRLLFIPGTIGSITWLARNESHLDRVVAGLVLACLGDEAPLTYKRSRRGDALIDRASAHVVSTMDTEGRVLDFVPWGWDERQFNSPGFGLPVGCLSRSREDEFDGYHSSADNLAAISEKQLVEAVTSILAIIDVVERDRRLLNLAPKGEPQLGKRGLYEAVGGSTPMSDQLAMLWVLNQSDGTASLLDIAERSGIPFRVVHDAASRLEDAGLLRELGGEG
jgi:aminopeptidase-like protein